MSTYFVCTTGEPAWFSINNHRPEGAEAPKTEGYMRYIPGTGFDVVMRCYESDPYISYTQPDDPVFKDSCMEVFLNCYPELPEYGYLNLEINASGASRCRFGVDREHRYYLAEKGLTRPEITVTKTEAYWEIHTVITEHLIEGLYERPCSFAPGHKMRGNFYKCGEEVPSPHWSSWVEMRRLDFHDPVCFGTFQIV